MEKYLYEFRKGTEVVEAGEDEMIYVRRRGLELAKEYNSNIRIMMYNKPLCKWQDLGYYTPEQKYVNSFGNICELNEDGRNFRIVG